MSGLRLDFFLGEYTRSTQITHNLVSEIFSPELLRFKLIDGLHAFVFDLNPDPHDTPSLDI
jgi:hypothetical protein